MDIEKPIGNHADVDVKDVFDFLVFTWSNLVVEIPSKTAGG